MLASRAAVAIWTANRLQPLKVGDGCDAAIKVESFAHHYFLPPPPDFLSPTRCEDRRQAFGLLTITMSKIVIVMINSGISTTISNPSASLRLSPVRKDGARSDPNVIFSSE
jgi:hypothetical protein